jgi:hypothetical protein
MGVISKVIESVIEEGLRIVKLLRFGESDNINPFLLSSFGEDFNPPKGYDCLYIQTSNSSEPVCIGFINKVTIDSLKPGEKQIFSTNEGGDDIKAYIKLLSSGKMHFNGNTDFIAGFNDLKSGFDELKTDFNNHVQNWNTFAAAYVPGGPSALGTPPIATSSSNSNASIDSSKKTNLKTE